MWGSAGTAISESKKLETGVVFRFAAEEIRREGTGVHCRAWIYQDGLPLIWGRLNLEDPSARQWMANKAYEKLGKAEKDAWPKNIFAYEFDRFCAGVWPRWVGQTEACEVGGDPEIPPVGHALAPYVLDEGGVIAFAPPGSGKSWLMYLMAQSIHHGVEAPFWQAQRRSVLVVNLERPERSVRRRMTAVNLVLGLPTEASLPVLTARGRSLLDVLPAVEREVRERKVDVLFLDSLSRAGYGKLIADEVANSAMDTLNRLAPSWFLLAHTPRSDHTHTFGSVMFDAAADLTLMISAQHRAEKNLMGVAISGEKANDVPKPELKVYALSFDQHGLDEFRLAKKGEFAELEQMKPMSLADELYAFLMDAGAMSATEIEQEIQRPRQKIVPILRNDPRFGIVRKEGRSVLYGVTHRENEG